MTAATPSPENAAVCPLCHKPPAETAAENCSTCHVLLSPVRPGSLLGKRYRVTLLKTADAICLLWLAEDLQARKQCLVREYAGPAPEDKQGRRALAAAARQLRELGELIVAPEFHFAEGSRAYLVEELRDCSTLADLIQSGGPLSTERVRTIYWQAVEALDTLHRLSPPVYHGNISAAAIVLAGTSLRFTNLTLGGPAKPAEVAAADDLRAVARVMTEALAGNKAVSGPLSPEALKSIETLADSVLQSVFDWALTDGPKRPSGAAGLREFRDDLQGAADAERSGNIDEAVRLLDRAYNRSGSSLIKQRLGKLKEDLAAKAKPQTPDGPPPPPQPASVPPPAPDPPTKIAAPVPEAPDPVEPPPTSVPGMKTCAVCGAVSDDLNKRFCSKCGGRLTDPDIPTPAPESVESTIQPASAPAPTPAAVPATTTEHKKRNTPLLVMAGLAVASALGGVIWYVGNSVERDFDSRLKAGDLDGAVVFYQKALTEKGPNSSLVKRMNDKVLPVLTARSEEVFRNWRQNSDIAPMTWDGVLRSEQWRAQIQQTGESQAKVEYAQGMIAFTRRMYGEARSRYERALALHEGKWALAHNAIGRSYFNLRMYKEAEHYYRLAAAADPSWHFPHSNLGNLYRDVLHDDVRAEAEYMEAIRLDASRSSFHFSLAQLLYRQGTSHVRACEEYRRALAGSTPLSANEAQLAQQRLQRCN